MMLLLLLACPSGPKGNDSGTTFSTFPTDDTAYRPDTGPRDTGPYAAIFYEGLLSGDTHTLTDGQYGFAAYRYNARQDHSNLQQSLCRSYARLVNGDPIDAVCTDCDYTYSLIGTEGGGSEGDLCQHLIDSGMGAMDPTAIDAYFVGFSFGIGWVQNYRGNNFGAVMQYQFDYPEYGWFLFAYDYDVTYSGGQHPPNGKASGGGGKVSWTRPARDRNSNYEVYYDY